MYFFLVIMVVEHLTLLVESVQMDVQKHKFTLFPIISPLFQKCIDRRQISLHAQFLVLLQIYFVSLIGYSFFSLHYTNLICLIGGKFFGHSLEHITDIFHGFHIFSQYFPLESHFIYDLYQTYLRIKLTKNMPKSAQSQIQD